MNISKLLSCAAIALFALSGTGLTLVAAQNQATSQAPPPAAAQNTVRQASPDSADLAITATVNARELRFDVVPNPTVEFTGKPKRETVWDAERQNLPRPVQPGVTYRDIGIRLTITSVFADIDRIVAEALGEVPVTDNAPQEKNAQPAPSPPTQPTPQQKGGPPR